MYIRVSVDHLEIGDSAILRHDSRIAAMEISAARAIDVVLYTTKIQYWTLSN